MEKCHFCTQEAHFLEHVVETHGVAPDPEKIEKVDKYLTPKCLREVRSFLELARYYRKFIKDYFKKAKLLTNLTQKEWLFEWTNDQQKAFEELKKSLTSQSVLKYLDFKKEFTLMTRDARRNLLDNSRNYIKIIIIGMTKWQKLKLLKLY